MDKKKIILVSILSVIAVGLLGYGVYYLFSGDDGNTVTTDLEVVTPSANKVDQVAIRDLDIEVTNDNLPDTDGVLTEIDYETFKSLFTTSKRSILILVSNTCDNCTEYLPEVKDALGTLGIEAYEIVIDNLGVDEDITKYIAFKGTPTTYIIENGNVTHTFTGKTSSKTIQAFFDLYYLR